MRLIPRTVRTSPFIFIYVEVSMRRKPNSRRLGREEKKNKIFDLIQPTYLHIMHHALVHIVDELFSVAKSARIAEMSKDIC